jgi:hypothetical protein
VKFRKTEKRLILKQKNMSIQKPILEKFSAYFRNYINLVKEDDLILALRLNLKDTTNTFEKFVGDKENFAYSEVKWTVKEVLSHIIDVERVFAYRALRFSRQDATELSGYDDDLYVANSNAQGRSLKEMLREFVLLRESTIYMFSYFNENMLDFEGKANQNVFTARALGFMIVGHTKHHSSVVHERY